MGKRPSGGEKVSEKTAVDERSLQHVVGIGSSAGGLEALELLLGSLAGGGRSAFVVAQHLSPEHPSLLTELLSRVTDLSVVEASDNLLLTADVIVIASPGQDVMVVGDRIRVIEPTSVPGPHPSIDLLFESIADQWAERSVGVVLSGTGSDGAYGLRRIKAVDGLTVVQSPQSAKFEAMPRAALAAGVGDLVLEPVDIGQRLSRLGTPDADWLGEVLPEPEPDALTSIINELRRTTGVDFSRYKESTLRRQIKRRMAILQVAGIADYLPLLVADPSECAALLNGLLVTVTSFFRDPESFEALREQLRAYLADRDPAEMLRVWVPGCATGEEVYSIAMMVSDLLGSPTDLDGHLKIFGTDLDEAALTIARRGIYPSGSLSALPDGLADRYMVPTAQGLEVSPDLRSAVVFARHNVGQDPPFPHLDLVSCRNTLIYFTAPLQRRVLEMFAYALRPGGLLFLGSSEALVSDAVGFSSVDANHRVFTRTHERVVADKTYVPGPRLKVRGIPTPTVGILDQADIDSDIHVAVLEALAESRTKPCLVLDERHEVVEVVGDVIPYCRIAQGRPSRAAASFLRPELAAEARALLLIVRARGERTTGRPLRVEGSEADVRLTAGPLPVGDRSMVLLEFESVPTLAEEPQPQPVATMGERGPEFDAEVDRLERELLRSQTTLQESLADLETAHEELLASNEELQASSEELQSSYEELATSNEELQASNEELSVNNRQLSRQTEELNQSRNEAQSLLGDFTRVTDALREVVWQRDLTFMRLVYVSQRVEDLFGIPRAQVGEMAAVLDDCILEADRERVWASRSVTGTGWVVDYRIQAKDGVERWITERGSVVGGVAGGDRVVGTLTDVTEQMNAVRREGEQRQIFEAVFRAPFFGVAILDTESRVLMANEALCSLLGYDRASIVRMPMNAFTYPEGDSGVRGRASHVGSEPAVLSPTDPQTRRLMRRDGSSCWANVDVRPLPQVVGDAASMLIVRDVTRLHDQTEELAVQAATDANTGLLNREHFHRVLERQIAESAEDGSTLALVWMDADNFKDVNDQFGHAAGDEVLRTCAERLESAVRSMDVVGRVGGDEFGVILSSYGEAADLEAALDRMLWAIRQSIPLGDSAASVTGSIGVAMYPEDGTTSDVLMQAAVAAMSAVKGRGGDACEYFRAEMTEAADERRRLRGEVARAIEQQDFELFYQPIVDVSTGVLWGVESLLRWNRNGSIVAAADFIDFCEASGQIRALAPLTFTLFRKDLDLFRKAGCDIGQACINVSASQLEDRTFTDLMGWWPSPSGLTGVVVEVTESVFLPDHGRAVAALRMLSELGALVSVDDFGSGYSNLVLLESLAPACIKLDRSFVAAHSMGQRGRDLLSAAIQMAHAVDSIVIAEGIEEAAQQDLVRELGADMVQGYLVARPMSANDLVAWIRARP